MNNNTAPDALDRRLLLGAAGIAGLAAFSAASKAAGGGGPLNPPAGAVASTGKPLTDVEPRTAVNAANTPGSGISLFRISQPGSYYLTGNIQGVANKHGIDITTGGVTLDLQGFTVQGVSASINGITVAATGLAGIAVHNGYIRGFGGHGLVLSNQTRDIRVGNITATDNATGIIVSTGAVVHDCVAANNSGSGISADNNCTISNCVAITNGDKGIELGSDCRAMGCICTGNARGIDATTNCHVQGCTTVGNTAEGIRLQFANTALGNTVRSNPIGIRAPGNASTLGINRIEANICLSCQTSYLIESGNNVLSRNTSALAALSHWNIASGNYITTAVPAAAIGFNAASGGAPLAPAGYDPNTNFTLA